MLGLWISLASRTNLVNNTYMRTMLFAILLAAPIAAQPSCSDMQSSGIRIYACKAPASAVAPSPLFSISHRPSTDAVFTVLALDSQRTAAIQVTVVYEWRGRTTTQSSTISAIPLPFVVFDVPSMDITIKSISVTRLMPINTVEF